MSTMFYVLTYLAVNYVLAAFASRTYLPGYWIEVPKEDLEEYQQKGRTCEQCHFPFSYESRLNYGCRPYQGLEFACKNIDGVFIECPETCPLGSAHFFYIKAFAGLDDDSVVLKCSGWASPTPTITWMKDGEVIEVVEPTEDQYPSIANVSITLRYQDSDYGLYSCNISNGYSSDSSHGTEWRGNYNFTGERLPTIPTNLKLLSQFRTYVTLGWSYDEQQPSSSKYWTSYEIRMTPGRPVEREESDIVLIRMKNYTIKHLEPGVEYTLKVRRINKHGYGQFSQPLYVTIPEDAPIDRPVNVTVTHVDSTSVILKYDMDAEDEVCQYCTIHFQPGLQGQNKSVISAHFGNNETITGLTPGTKYTFEVVALMDLRVARRSEPVIITTLLQAPLIKSLHVYDDDHNVVVLKCKVFGGPLPQIVWKKDTQPITDENLFNTTISEGTVISTLTLPRNAFVYTEYSCEASNSEGNAAFFTTVDYKGNHPQVSLERLVMELSEDVKKIKQDLDEIKSNLPI